MSLIGSVKEQEVNFISKETLSLLGKTIEVDHFKLKSTDDSLEEDKKLDYSFCLLKSETNNILVTSSLRSTICFAS